MIQLLALMIFVLLVVLIMYIGWPLHEIAMELRKLRQLAERGRRD